MPSLTEIYVPQYIQGIASGSSNTKRLPYAYCVTLSGLTANATYRYYNSGVLSTDTATENGVGNVIFVTTSGSFTRTTGASLSSAGNYGTFTTDGSGNFTGWFIVEPTGNSRYATAGNQIFMRIMLNDGGSGTSVATRLTTTSAATVTAFNTSGANTGTGIYGTSYATDKNFVLLYDNTAGTGRPLAGTLVEADGVAETTGNSYVSFYSSSVNEVSGAWGTIIPNNLANGVRRVEQRAKSDAALVAANTDSDGAWPSGVNTVNPAGGDATPKVIATSDAPLNEPTTDATSVSFSSVGSTSMTVSWSSGNGANRIVVVRQGSATSFTPTDFSGISGTVNADVSAATDQGSGNKVCYNGNGSSFMLTGLSASTTYHVTVFEYTGSATTANYLTAVTPATVNQPTTAGSYSAQSDIVRASGFSEPANIAYENYQATDISGGNALELARFTIRDGGGAADADSVETTLDAINFSVANGGNLRRVALYAGGTEIAEVAGGTSVSFSSLSGLAATDGGATNFSVLATFNATVTDNQQLELTVNTATANAGGSTFAAGNAGGAASDITGDANRIEVTATQLAFSSVPASVNVNANFSATVQARDANSNLDLDDTTSVTITKASGNGTLAGGGAQGLVSGAQTWTSLQIDTPGNFTIQAAGGSLTAATSGNIGAVGVVTKGDVAIIRLNGSTDGLTVLALRNLLAGEVLYWTDDGWTAGNAFRGAEGAGTTDVLTSDIAAGSTFDVTASSLNASGEQLFLFTGTKASPTLVYGADWGNTQGWDADSTGTGDSADPAVSGGGLDDEETVSIAGNPVKYTGTKTGTKAQLLAAIANFNNWSTTSDTSWGDGNFTIVTPAAEPATQAQDITFNNVTATQMDVSWTDGDGASRLVICRQGSAPSSGPLDGTTYTADPSFTGAGDSLGGGKVVYIGTGNSFTLNGLSASTTYHLEVYEFNGSGNAINYLTTTATGNPNSQATEAPANSTQSDIIRASSFTEPANVAYQDYQAADITDANSLELARFTIRDGGASSDPDSFGTTLSAISFAIANGGNLRRVALYDGTAEIAEVAGGTTATFSGLSGLSAADGGTKDLSVRVTFNTAVTDNQQLQFTVSSATADFGGSIFAAADAGAAASDVTGDANRMEVTATKLVFSSAPSTVAINQNFLVTVQAQDANDNVDLDNAALVTISKASGSGTLTGGGAQSLVNGALTFSSLQIDTAGVFTVSAADSPDNLTDATSGNITTSVFTTQTANFSPVILPQVMGSGNSTRLPVMFRATVSGLAANTTYRYYTSAAISTDFGTANAGAGNPMLINSSGTTYTYTSSTSLTTVGGYESFITDGFGEFTGWFGFVNTGNARFTAGNTVYPVIVIGSDTGTLLHQWATTTGIQVLAFSTSAGANNGTGIRGTSYATAKNFVALFDNTVGTGQPLAVTYVESEGISVPSAVGYYGAAGSGPVDGVAGAWGTIIPNTLANGVRRIAQYDLAGNLVAVNTDADGAWPSSVNTVNPGGGSSTALVMATTDAPLNEPTADASSVAFSSVTSNSMTASWTSGNGAKRIVVVREGSATSFVPSDFSTISGVNADFSAATDQGSGNKVCYDDTGSSFSLTGLSAYTTYYVTVFEYNGSGSSANYLTTGTPATGSQLTSCTVSANEVNVSRPIGLSFKLNDSTLLANASGSGPVTVSGIDATSGNGVSLTHNEGWVYYNGNLTANDSFHYTVSVPGGCNATALVNITATNPAGLSSPSIAVNGGNVTAVFHGIPGYPYSVQRATNASFTGTLSNFPPVIAPTSGDVGQISVTDDFSDLGFFPESAFYRLMVP